MRKILSLLPALRWTSVLRTVPVLRFWQWEACKEFNHLKHWGFPRPVRLYDQLLDAMNRARPPSQIMMKYRRRRWKAKAAEESRKKTDEEDSKSSGEPDIRIQHPGVWTVVEPIVKRAYSFDLPWKGISETVSEYLETIPYLLLFARDLIAAGWLPILLYPLAHIASSVFPSLLLFYSANFYETIQRVITKRETDPNVLIAAIIRFLAYRVISHLLGQFNETVQPMIHGRLRLLTIKRVIQAHIRLDLPTREDPEVKAQLDQLEYGNPGIEVFEQIVQMIGNVLRTITQLTVVWSTFRSANFGTEIMAAFLVGPISSLMIFGSGYHEITRFESNKNWLRIVSVQALATIQHYHREVLGEGLQEFIQQHFDAAQAALGNISLEPPQHKPGWAEILFGLASMLSNELPLIMVAVQVLRHPESFQLTSFVLLQEANRVVSQAVYTLYRPSGLIYSLKALKTFYEALNIENQIKDGTEPFPPLDDKHEPGMTIEFKNVSFVYPQTAEGTKMALDDLSFKIKAGQLCVIVGENGCGKSSTIKLLTRLYDVTSGEILLENRPLTSFKIADVRRALAVMHQDYMHLPLSLAENIGLGQPSNYQDLPTIHEAAKLGGAYDFIQELPRGFETVASGSVPATTSGRGPMAGNLGWMGQAVGFGRDITNRLSPPDLEGVKTRAELKRRMDATKPPSFSGGQYQRLAVSRTFMHSTGGAVKALAYDEPSAALDPKAEFELFQRLRNLRGQKTMIFVTHRFGHLTKHADLILYMKKGKVVEQGTHAELLALDGEYAHLYQVQAQAFVD